jgi:excisionase family DNA binding protein
MLPSKFKRAYGISEFAEMFSISKDATKRAVKRGDLRTICIGRRRLIPLAEIERIEKEGLGKRREAR